MSHWYNNQLEDVIRTSFGALDAEHTNVLSKENFRVFVSVLTDSFMSQVLEKDGSFKFSDMDIDPHWRSVESVWTEHRGVTLSKLLWCKTVFEWKLEDTRNTY